MLERPSRWGSFCATYQDQAWPALTTGFMAGGLAVFVVRWFVCNGISRDFVGRGDSSRRARLKERRDARADDECTFGVVAVTQELLALAACGDVAALLIGYSRVILELDYILNKCLDIDLVSLILLGSVSITNFLRFELRRTVALLPRLLNKLAATGWPAKDTSFRSRARVLERTESLQLKRDAVLSRNMCLYIL